MPFSIDTYGVDPLLAALDDYPAIFDEEMEQASTEAFDFLRSPLREYGPEAPGQRYVRTYKLQAGWDDAQPEYHATGGGFEARMENPTSYGPYVQGGADDSPHQAKFMADRWNTDDAIVQDNESEIKQFFEQATDRLTKRLGG